MKPQKLNRIKKIAAAARAEIKKMARSYGIWYVDHYNLGGACGIASYLLHQILTKHGFRSQLMYGEFEGGCHFWVEVDGKIVDITHTQFAREADPVSVFPRNRKGFRRDTWRTKDAKRELFKWDSYKVFQKRLDNAEQRLLKQLGS